MPLFSVKSTVLDCHPRLRDFDQRFAIEASADEASHPTAFGCDMNRIAQKLVLAIKQPERTDGRMAHISISWPGTRSRVGHTSNRGLATTDTDIR